MILTVNHVTHYRYDQPVRGVVQSHRLYPSCFDGQRVIVWDVTLSDGIAGGAFRDAAGDWIQGYSVQGPVDALSVTVTGQVETRDLAGVLSGHRESIPPEAYLVETPPTRADRTLIELGRAAKGSTSDLLEQAHRLSGAISDAIVYRPGVTAAHTTAAEALALGEGVCQDHAHALIASARSADIPARYVSGYLLVGEDRGEAAHAWAELWVAGLGWVGFDPANRCCPDARYIRLGSGMDARDAAPIRGIARGLGAETMDVSVAIQSVQQ